MPKAHREFAAWTPQRMIAWAAQNGPATAQVVEKILARKAYAEQGFRSCMGIISLAKRYSRERLEMACQRALAIRDVSYRSIKSILEHHLDQRPLPTQMDCFSTGHDNIRGAEYYTNERNIHAHPTDH